MEYAILERLWNRLCPYIDNDANARLYESCLRQIRSLVFNEDERQVFGLWSTFWTYVARKSPDIAAEYIEDFFQDVFEDKQVIIAGLLSVSNYMYRVHPERCKQKGEILFKE